MELKILLKNTSYLIASRVVQFFVGIVGSKLIAIFLGPLGAGIISQLQDIVSKMANLTLMSINNGLVKQIAEIKTSISIERKLVELLKSYITIIIPLTIISLILLYLFSKELTVYIFGDIKYINYFIIGLISFPVLIINSISFALLKGFKEIKYLARSEMIVSIANFILFVPLIYFGGVTGAIISVPLSLVSYLIANNHFAKTKILMKYNILINNILSANINKRAIKELFVFAGVGIISGSTFMFSEIACRSIVVTKLGIEQLGLYKPVISWAALFVGFIMPSLTTYLYPRFSEAQSNSEISGVLNDVLRLISFMMLPLLFLAIPIKFQIIPLFYSKEFRSAGQYLPWHFIGTLIYLWMFALRSVFTPIGRIKLHGTLVVIMSLLDFLIVYYFVPIYGLYGYMLKFIISPILFFLFCIFYLNKIINFKIDRKNKLIMSYVFISTLILIAFCDFDNNNYLLNLFVGITLTIASYLFLTTSEKKFIAKKLKL